MTQWKWSDLDKVEPGERFQTVASAIRLGEIEIEKFTKKDARRQIHQLSELSHHAHLDSYFALLAVLVLKMGKRVLSERKVIRTLSPRTVPGDVSVAFFLRVKELARLFNHTPDVSRRLTSIANYGLLWGASRESMMSVQTVFERAGYIQLLELVENAFSSRATSSQGVADREDIVHKELKAEELASVVSFILGSAPVGTTKYLLRGGGMQDEELPEILLKARSLMRLQQVEHAVFFLDYDIDAELNGRFALSPPSDDFGRFLSLGYINHGFASLLAGRKDVPGATSFGEVFGARIDDLASGLFFVSEDKPKRLQLRLPEPVLGMLGKILMNPGLFKEEVVEFEKTASEFGATVKDLDGFRITKGELTVARARSFHRIFMLISMAKNSAIRSLIKDGRGDVVANSVLSLVPKDGLMGLLLALGAEVHEAAEYIRALSWVTESEELLDLQSKPIIVTGESSIVLLSTLTCSNFIRNTCASQRSRLYADGIIDPVARILAPAFQDKGGSTAAQVKFSNGEIDVVAQLDGRMFVVECKSTLHPTSFAELRTLVDYLRKAAHQLKRFEESWEDASFREIFWKKTGIEGKPPKHFCAAIVTNSRLLSGINWQGIPVRHVGEFANVIRSGKFEMHVGEARAPFIWEPWANKNTVERVTDYLGSRSCMHEVYRASFMSEEEVHEFGSTSLSERISSLNIASVMIAAGVPVEYVELAARTGLLSDDI